MSTVKALCEVVADVKAEDGSGKKVGEEVRFYDGTERGGALVKTVHLDRPDEFGKYKEGEFYEVEPDTR